ncbi:hypothetical protein DD238_000991 [Peronospora effusa]|uniref:Uncharacterized protein n=1 Tax=Peronospora effusa TaxID=542832 RepID=A0A3M6VWT8_9STRA|nr:hypothetical protein DD238_000991 [Peronospora effusa]RQM12283.1 hypothetical protein DD237_005708 [Peronospora effusa]
MRFPLPAERFPTLVVSKTTGSSSTSIHSSPFMKLLMNTQTFALQMERCWMKSYGKLSRLTKERHRTRSVEISLCPKNNELTQVLRLLLPSFIVSWHDQSFGLINANASLMKIKSSYTKDKSVDA